MSPAPKAAVPSSPFSGKTLGRCKIGRPIGRGATATVFHAHYLPLKRDVAVKILRSDAATSPEARQRFIDEAKALAKLDHENVVRVFDVVEDEGLLLIVMDFVKGRNLRQVLEEDGPLDPETAILQARQIALALDHAHANKILHRDVKPGNVIVGEDGKVVLVDFGNADAVGDSMDRKGTAHYVAPEVFQGKRQDEKTDTYSLGATLFHMLTGETPFEGQKVKEILAAHEAGKIRSPSSVNEESGIPKELDVLVKRSMAAARGYRFAARDFAAELEGVVAAVRAGGKKVRTRKARGRSGTVEPAKSMGPVYAGGAVLLAGIGVAIYAASGGGAKPAAPPPAPVVAPSTEQKSLTDAIADGKAHGKIDPGLDKRADTRQAREDASKKALADAGDFAAKNPGKPKEIAAKFASVAGEYADLEAGRLARAEETTWRERGLTDTEKAARELKSKSAAEMKKSSLEAGLKRVSESVQAMQFSEAVKRLDETEPPDGKEEEWKRRDVRLTSLLEFPQMIHESLQGSPVKVLDVRNGFAKAGEKATGADGRGLTLNTTVASRTLPWSEIQPADVLGLCRKSFRNAPEPRIALAVYCWEAGLKDDAKREMDNAMLTDRTGTVPARLEELFGPEEQR
jgi:serine/threonine protein kinase